MGSEQKKIQTQGTHAHVASMAGNDRQIEEKSTASGEHLPFGSSKESHGR